MLGRHLGSMLFVFAFAVLGACGVEIGDGAKDFVDVDEEVVDLSVRQRVLASAGGFFAVGSTVHEFQGSGECCEEGQEWHSVRLRASFGDLRDNGGWSTHEPTAPACGDGELCGVHASRVVGAAHPALDVLYLAGGLYAARFTQGRFDFLPSLQRITAQDIAEDALATSVSAPASGGGSAYLVHPAAAPYNALGVPPGQPANDLAVAPHDPAMEASFDEVGYFDARQGMVPMALQVFTYAGATRLLAFLPHGLHSGEPTSEYGDYHRRALAIFDLDPATGAVQDACPNRNELRWQDEGAGGSCDDVTGAACVTRQTTDPAWLIDLPDALFSARAAVPPTRFVYPESSSAGLDRVSDGRLQWVEESSGGFRIEGAHDGSFEFLRETYMPGEPVMLVDTQNGRAYVLVNRWMGGTTGDDEPGWTNLYNRGNGGAPTGFAALFSFSLQPPSPAPACAVTRPAYNDPFADRAVPAAAADVDFALLELTAAVEPMVLSEVPSVGDGNSFSGASLPENIEDVDLEEILSSSQSYTAPFSPQGSKGCDLGSTRTTLDGTPGQVTARCVTDAVPYSPMALDAERGVLVVTQTSDDTVLIIEAGDLSARTHVRVGRAPVSVAVDNNGRAYVVNRDSHTLSVLDLDARRVTKTVDMGRYPVNVHVDAARDGAPMIYVVNLGGDNLAAYDGKKTRFIRFTKKTCLRPGELALHPATRRALVLCKGSALVPNLNIDQRDGSDTVSYVPPRTFVFDLLD